MTLLLPFLPSPSQLLGETLEPGRPQVRLTTERLYDSLKKGAVTETGDEDRDWVALLLLASVGDQLDAITEVVSDTDDGPGWSSALNVDRAPEWALRWLGQFVGVRVPPGLDEETSRAMVRDESAFSRGTLAAIKQAGQRFLRPGHEVQVDERDTDAFHLTVTVFTDWLIGATYAELSASYATYTALTAAFPTYDSYSVDVAGFTAAMQAAKPIRLVMDVVIAVTASYSYLSSHYAAYPTLAASFPTYDVMTDYRP